MNELEKQETSLKYFILKMAACKFDISNTDVGFDEFRIFRHYMNEVIKEGYVYNEGNIVGVLSPRFTDNGCVFWEKGGYANNDGVSGINVPKTPRGDIGKSIDKKELIEWGTLIAKTILKLMSD